MKALITISVATAAAWMALSAPDLPARDLPRSSAEAVDDTVLRRQFFGSIATIDRAAKILVVEDQSLGRQRLLVDERTKIRQGDKAATWSDFEVGAMVDGICVGAPHHAYAEVIYLGR